MKDSVSKKLLNRPSDMDVEVDIGDLIKKDPTSSISYVKSPDNYKVEEYEDVEEHFGKYITLYKRHLEQEVQPDSLFRAYRAVLDLQQFKDMKNSLVFWKEYIRQLFEQLPLNEQTKLWNTLQDMLGYYCKIFLSDNTENDHIFLIESLKTLSNGAPFMCPEQLQTLANKASLNFPLAGLTFLEPYLDKTMQKEHSISETAVYMCFEDMLVKIKEKDLAIGLRKTILDKDRDKNTLTMLQLRDYVSAEELCEEIIQETDLTLPTEETLKDHITKTIIEESWIEIMKNMNEWPELFKEAENTERKDLVLEAAFFTSNTEKLESIMKKTPEEENATNYIYYALAVLYQDHLNPEPFDGAPIKQFKEKMWLLLMKDWFFLPKVFSENHIYQIAMSHFWNEFEEGFDILQELRARKNNEQQRFPHLLKLKEDVFFINMIRRQRLPNEADGLVNCKKIMEQRSMMSHILYGRTRQFIDTFSNVPNMASVVGNPNDNSRYNVFNETVHDALMYAKIERSFGVYNTIQVIAPRIDKMIDEKMISTQTDEFYYYHELIKFWSASDGTEEPPIRVISKLVDESFNKDFRSDLHATIMGGYLEKHMLEKANQHGIEALKLNEDNWKLWTKWFDYFKKNYYINLNSEKSLFYFKEMLKAYIKAIKYKTSVNIVLFGEILHVLYFRDDLVKSKYNSDEAMKQEVVQVFDKILTETPIWSWTIWLGNLVLNVYKKTSLKLDDTIIKALNLSSQIYKPYVHYTLNSVLGSVQLLADKRDKDLEEIMERCKNHPISNLKLQDSSMNELFSLFRAEDLHNKNDYPEMISSVYACNTIESRMLNQFNAKCKDIGEGFNQFRNQDNTQKLTTIINLIDDYLARQKCFMNKKPRTLTKSTVYGAKFCLLNISPIYNDRTLLDFFQDGYLLPDIKVVYEGRRFGLQVEFVTPNQKKLVYTLKKHSINSAHLMCYNHYLKLMNIEMHRNNETVFRSLRFSPLDMLYLEDDFCLKAKPPSEVNLIDILDNYMVEQGKKVDHVLDYFANKKSVSDINKTMTEQVEDDILRKEILKKLKSEYDLFLWKKRYAQSLGVNMINTLLFVKGSKRLSRS